MMESNNAGMSPEQVLNSHFQNMNDIETINIVNNNNRYLHVMF